MNLSKNSLTARLYRWFYNKNTMPANLCPYFWQLVWMWLTIIPFMVYTLPFQLFIRFRKEDSKETLEIATIGYVVLFLSACMVISIIHLFAPYDGDNAMIGFVAFGIIAWIILFFIGAGFLIISVKDYLMTKRYQKKYQNNLQSESPKPNSVVVEFVKATYNKYCPQIKWN